MRIVVFLPLLAYSLFACGGIVSGTGSSSSSGGDTPQLEPSPEGPTPEDPSPIVIPPGSSAGSSGNISTLSSLDSTCDGNAALTARAMLDNLDAQYTPYFGRDGAPTSRSTIVISYNAGAIRCKAAFRSTGGAPDMEATLEVDVSAKVTSDDGALNEVVSGTLSRSVSSAVMDFVGRQPAGAIGGTLTLEPMDGFDVALQYGLKIHPGFHQAGGELMQQGTRGNVGQVRRAGTFNP